MIFKMVLSLTKLKVSERGCNDYSPLLDQFYGSFSIKVFFLVDLLDDIQKGTGINQRQADIVLVHFLH